jgi:hypothetical protein
MDETNSRENVPKDTESYQSFPLRARRQLALNSGMYVSLHPNNGFETAKKSSNPVSPPDESVLWLWQDSNKNARKKADGFCSGESLKRPIPQCLCGRKGVLW